MTVDELLNIPQLSQTSENTWKVDGLVIPKTWGQGRTAFGGISAGMLYTAVKQQVTDNRVLRSFTTNFVGPLSLESPFSIEVTLLRTGKNVSQYTCLLYTSPSPAIEDGGIPFTRRKTSHYHGFMRFKQAPEAITDAHIITMIDAWPPTLLQMMKLPAPASTVSWNLEFIHPHKPVSPTDWFGYKAHTRQAADGYGHTEATIWDKDNEVIAISRQTVAIFD